MDTTPEGAIRRTAATTAIDVNEEYDFPLAIPFGEGGGGLFGLGGNLPRARARLTFEELAEMRRQQREHYDMFTEDTRAQRRVAEARGNIREQQRNLRGPRDPNYTGGRYNEGVLRQAEGTLEFFRERGRNADRRANEIEIAEANAAGRRRRAELDQTRTVRPRV